MVVRTPSLRALELVVMDSLSLGDIIDDFCKEIIN